MGDEVIDFHSIAHGAARLRELLVAARTSVLRPPPRMSVPDWADRYRVLSTSAGAVGGPWQTHRVEVARGPMMAVTEPGVQTVTAMCCTQVLKTELLMNTLGYFAHLDPAPMLVLQPKDELVDAFSKERIAPMIASSPELRKIMGDHRTRTGDDTLRFKKFPGGFMAVASAGSPTNLAMRAIRVVLMDEIDKYEPTKEGDPVVLAEERMATFNTSSLSIRACSPTWEETSRIFKSYMSGDQRRPYVHCPHCNDEVTLDFFRDVLWEKDEDGNHLTDTAHIHCPSCGTEWTEAERLRLLTTKHAIRHMQTKVFHCCGERQDPQVEKNWEWREDIQVGYARCKHCGERGLSNRHASFQVSKLYNPFNTVVMLAEKWIAAKDDPETKQTFYNTQLGIPYKMDVSRAADGHWLSTRAEVFEAEVPEGGLVLTAGIDVQAGGSGNLGRLEVEVVAWGIGEESWSVAVEVFNGDPAKDEVWEQLDAFLKKGFMHQRGFPLYITAACIDSGGHNTQEVYKFARARIGRNIWAIKGTSQDRGAQWSPIWPMEGQGKKAVRWRTGYKPIILGVNSAKEAVRQRLLIEEFGPGYCHFPIGRGESWFEQLTSEDLRVERKAGVMMRKWVLKKGKANEALDCRVYAYSALQGLYIVRRLDLHVRAATLAQMKGVVMLKDEDGGDEAMPVPKAPPVPTGPRRGVRSRSSFGRT